MAAGIAAAKGKKLKKGGKWPRGSNSQKNTVLETGPMRKRKEGKGEKRANSQKIGRKGGQAKLVLFKQPSPLSWSFQQVKDSPAGRGRTGM